jgi:hypothetical protein
VQNEIFQHEDKQKCFMWTDRRLLESYSTGVKMSEVCEQSIATMILTWKDQVHWHQPIPLTFCAPQITHGMARDRTRASQWQAGDYPPCRRKHTFQTFCYGNNSVFKTRRTTAVSSVIFLFISYRAVLPLSFEQEPLPNRVSLQYHCYNCAT